MSNDLCSPFNCNICLMLRAHQQPAQNPVTPSTIFPKLLTCSGCQLVKYCNREHQKLDWPLHREFCQAIQKIKQTSNVSHPFYLQGVPQSKPELEKVIIQLKYLLKTNLKRNLEYQEEELSSFPAYCAECFKFKNLKFMCEICSSQVYCSDEHKTQDKERHLKVCDLLKIYYCPYKVLPLTDDLPLKFNKKIEDFHEHDLKESFESIFSLKLPLDPCKSLIDYQRFASAADFSCIMSICYVMDQLQMQQQDIDKFSIFVMGASIEAVLWFRELQCKLFFLQNPNVTELQLHFIGPEVVETEYNQINFKFLDQQRLVTLHYFKGLFQDYCKYYAVKPSLMVAFNCGFSEFSQCYNLAPFLTNLNSLEPLELDTSKINAKDTWFEGLIEILQTFDIPIIFTSFTEQEGQFDFAALQNAAHKQLLKVQIKRILNIAKNPYHDLRPLRQWYSSDKEEFYYRNGYIQAIRTKLANDSRK